MSVAPTATDDCLSTQSAELAGRVAAEHLRALSPDEAFTARAFFDRHPDCARFKSVVLEVTLEEYVRRSCTGEQVSPSDIAGQFPAHRTAIARQIEVYQFLEDSPGLKDGIRWPEPGEEFLGLELQELLGVGAFSKVFRATEGRLGDRPVVVKICHGAGQEPAFLGRLGHPHITPIHWYRVCEETGLAAIVMPYLARSTMADVIDHCFSNERRPRRAADVASAVADLHAGSNLTVDKSAFSGSFADGALRWAGQLADALSFAHGHNICHSDIKPSNVLLTPAGNAVLVDFSMANDLAIDRQTIGGTFPYMAPEQLEAFLSGDEIPVSFATDLFSLGVTLYEFLTGRPPFGCPPADDSRHATAAWMLNSQQGQVPPVSAVDPRIPESISAIVMQCLALDPDRRPESALALCGSLKRQASVSRRILNGSRRHKWKLSAVCASVVVVAAFTVVHALTGPPRYETELQRGRNSLREGDTVDAIAHLTHGIDAFPPELQDSPAKAAALFERGRAYIGSDDFESAAQDFAAARAIQRDDPRFIAGLGYCEARLALANPSNQVETRIETAQRFFRDAFDGEGVDTPALRFNIAFLDFWQAINRRRTPWEARDPQLRLEALQASFEAVSAELDELAADLSDRPEFHLLRARIEYRLAGQSRIDTRRVDAAAARFPDDPRILTQAALAHAANARVADDSQMRTEDLQQCADCWNRALQSGAADADWNDLQSLTGDIPDAPPFRRPSDRTRSKRIPGDLLLNPLGDGEFAAPVAMTGT